MLPFGRKNGSPCRQRIGRDWQERFGFSPLFLETFVDPTRYKGTIYQAANWTFLGVTKGYQRTRWGESPVPQTPKKVFVLPLQRTTRQQLSCPVFNPKDQKGMSKMQLTAKQLCQLPECFKGITDPRRVEGRRHRIEVVLALAAAAVLCGMRG
jgi:hypothetical protein